MELKSLKEAYKFDKWDLFFENDEINKFKGMFVLHVVSSSLTFHNWIEEENKKNQLTNRIFQVRLEGVRQMSELETYKMVDEKYCSDCVCVIPSEVYLKSEADKVIARQKYRRCLAMADYAMYHHFRMLYIYGKSLDNDKAVFKINYGLRWRSRWLALAYYFKEAK